MTESRSSLIDRFTADLMNLGVRPGGVLLVHSSLRSLGLPSDLPDPAEIAVSALLAVLGQSGTLLMPALSYESVGAHQPVFNMLRTPSCVGWLPEYFRTRPGTLRSVHPTHSVCGVGRQAAGLLSDHWQDVTPCGPHSPFSRLPEAGGQVLFLGCGLRPNTSMHAIEERIEPPYLYGEPVEYGIILADDRTIRMTVRSHAFQGWGQRYDRLENILSKGLRQGRVVQAGCCLVEAAEMWPAALAALRQDPLFFVEKLDQ